MIRISLIALFLIGSVLAAGAEEPYASFMPDGLTLEKSACGSSVVDRELVGAAQSFPLGQRVYCWTLITGGKPGQLTRHVWSLDGVEIQTVELAVQGPYWRTWSYKTLFPEMAGSWKVEILDERNEVLGAVNFVATE